MIDPTDMTAVEWTDQMALFLPIIPMKIGSESEWREWAYHVIQNSEISRFNPPNPDFFLNWREWADRFNEVVELP